MFGKYNYHLISISTFILISWRSGYRAALSMVYNKPFGIQNSQVTLVVLYFLTYLKGPCEFPDKRPGQIDVHSGRWSQDRIFGSPLRCLLMKTEPFSQRLVTLMRFPNTLIKQPLLNNNTYWERIFQEFPVIVITYLSVISLWFH